MSAAGEDGPVDAARLRRMRWRSRRGLLENDLVLSRFFARFGEDLSEDDVRGIDVLLDLGDNELLDLILGRVEPAPEMDPSASRILGLLRSV